MSFGLWVLDIEDLYGDKQKIFWEGSSGDTVKLVDYNTKQLLATGILKKYGTEFICKVITPRQIF